MIRRLAEESLREVREVVRGHRSTDLAGELAGARSVLRAAGVACTVHGEDAGATCPGRRRRRSDGSRARRSRTSCGTARPRPARSRCGLPTARRSSRWLNDGVPDEVRAADGRPGTGLTGLGERLAAAGGSLKTRLDGSSFVLTASLPGGAAR